MTMVSWLRTKKVVRKQLRKYSLFFKARITRIARILVYVILSEAKDLYS